MDHSSALDGEALALPAKRSEPYLQNDALRRLVLDYYEREGLSLRRYAAFLGLSPESCEDIVQECFLRLHEHLASGGDQSNLRAWLFRVAHNLSRNSQTASYTKKTRSLSEVREVAEAVEATARTEEGLLRRERDTALRKQIEELSVPQRECLLLRTQGLKYREIAEVLQISTSAVAENVQRGLKRLKEAL